MGFTEKTIAGPPPSTSKKIALAGNPNVGKSTVFNALTGMKQHTGNWPGKTVANAQGIHHFRASDYTMVDLPGTYSLMAHSVEEEIARDYILFGGADAVIVVCDATCLERNLNLVLQVMEIHPKVIVCVNLMDEAKKKHIHIDLEALETELGVPVVGTSARSNKGLDALMEKVENLCIHHIETNPRPMRYPQAIRRAVDGLTPLLEQRIGSTFNTSWLALRLLQEDRVLIQSIQEHLDWDVLQDVELQAALAQAWAELLIQDIHQEQLQDRVVASVVLAAEEVAMSCVTRDGGCGSCGGCGGCRSFPPSSTLGHERDRKLDRILTSKHTGIPIMLALLCGIFWLTISGANVPSQLIADGLFWFQDRLTAFFQYLGAPVWLHDMLVLGVYRVLAWVVSVMLPPMAIFFPLFTLLEDFGYLPRVAFNLDHQFKKAKACGKQALTMCMGFGCNAAGVTGCRIIDSPRERLIAIITNNFVPCNGRFPAPTTRQQSMWV